jgi:hypothetical protein
MCSARAMKFISILAFVGILALGFTTLSFAQTSGQTVGTPPPQTSGDTGKNSSTPPKSAAKPDTSFGQKPGMPTGQSMADPSKNSAGKPKATDTTTSSSFGQKPGMPAGQSMADPAKNSAKPGDDSNVGNAPYPGYGKQGGTYAK